jgi:hypothetical protein
LRQQDVGIEKEINIRFFAGCFNTGQQIMIFLAAARGLSCNNKLAVRIVLQAAG